jgi:uncharacterized protein (TIGR00251 family)
MARERSRSLVLRSDDGGARDDGCAMSDAHVSVRLQPRASRDEISGLRDGVLVVRVTAPPVDGRANAALCKLIARRAGVAPSRVSVVRGERSRDKLVLVAGIEPDALAAALADAAP